MRRRPVCGEHAGVPERVTWVGHATVLIEMDGVRLLTDPVLRDRLAHLRRHGAPPGPDVAEGIDAVLLSHAHADHLDVRSLRRLGRDVLLVAPPGAGRAARRVGFTRAVELAPAEHVEVGGVTITAGAPPPRRRRRPPGPRARGGGLVGGRTPRGVFPR